MECVTLCSILLFVSVSCANQFSGVQALHRTIHTLEIGRNRLGNDGMESLKLGLMRNRSLQRLGIMELGITATGKSALLRQNVSLLQLFTLS